MRPFNLLSPESESELLEMLAEAGDDTRLIAGGTGILNLMKQRLASPETLISLHRVEGLSGIEMCDGELCLKAMTTLRDIEASPLVAGQWPVLPATLQEVASPRIRHMATIGGAIAHGDPNQDTPVTLTALDAEVLIRKRGQARRVPLGSFYTDYYETTLARDELVHAVAVPLPQPGAARFHKFAPRSLEDYACVSVAVRLDVVDGVCAAARICLGSVGPTIIRCQEAEALLDLRRIDAAIAEAAAASAAASTDPLDDTRGSAAYKRRMAAVWVRRVLTSAAQAAGIFDGV